MIRMRRSVAGVFVAVVLVVLPAAADAAIHTNLIGNFESPVQVAAPSWAPGSTIYVVEQAGQIVRREQGGHRNVVLDIRGRVLFDGSEQGLLSVAFGPDHKMWVYFTNNDSNLRVVRYTLNSGGGHIKSGSAHTVFRASHPDTNHNGGTLQFHAGHLYLSTGDGGGSCNSAAPGSAQSLHSKLGKFLRKDSNGWKIVGYGLRNPWRWSFDRMTGDVYIGDVGQGSHEEINFLPASRLGSPIENYGWNHIEGNEAGTCGSHPLNPTGDYRGPAFVYNHSGGGPTGSSVIGGFVYRGNGMPAQRGRYFFGDLDGWIRTADAKTLKNRQLLGFQVSPLTSFGQSSNGELYVVDWDGPVYKLVDN